MRASPRFSRASSWRCVRARVIGTDGKLLSPTRSRMIASERSSVEGGGGYIIGVLRDLGGWWMKVILRVGIIGDETGMF